MAADRHIETGQTLGPHVIDRIDPQKMKTVAALLQDPVPLHYDVEAVEALGLGNRLINQGPINVSYLLEMVSRFAGGHQAIRNFKVRLLGSVYEGERVVCTGKVVEVNRESGRATLEVEAESDRRPVLSAVATIQLAD